MRDLLGTPFLYPHCGQTGLIDAAFLHLETEKKVLLEKKTVHAKFCMFGLYIDIVVTT